MVNVWPLPREFRRSSRSLADIVTDNPYQAATASTVRRSAVAQSRWYGVGLSILSAVIGLVFGWVTLVIYAFSTMVDPEITGRERARTIADRFLFGDGPLQIVVVCLFMYLATTGLISAVSFLAFAIFRQPPLKATAMISFSAGAIVTFSLVAYLVTR
jgi:hypothetical protein